MPLIKGSIDPLFITDYDTYFAVSRIKEAAENETEELKRLYKHINGKRDLIVMNMMVANNYYMTGENGPPKILKKRKNCSN
jgi:hypothetical protein